MKQLYSLIFCCLLVVEVWGQDVYYDPIRTMIPGTYEFQLADGSRLRGQLVRNDSAVYHIRTREGLDKQVSMSDIVRADLIGGTFRLVPSHPNGFPFRLHFMPTAYMPEKKRLYYQNALLIMSKVDVGVTRHWSVGAGFHNLRPHDFFTLSTKLGTKVTEKMRIGLQGQYLSLRVSEQSNVRFTLVQGLVTVGGPERNITVGVGATLSEGGLGTSGVATIGYVRKVAPDLTLVNQNTIFIGESVDPQFTYLSGISTFGLRFDRRRHAFDLAAMLPVYTVNRLIRTTVLPYGSYQIRIGR